MWALKANATGTWNTAVGYNALATGAAVSYATALGANTVATGNGSVALGVDSAGTPASTAVANEIKLGTALHTTNHLGSVLLGAPAPAVGATSGFPYIPSTAGMPTGVPTAIAGLVPLRWDSTARRLWVYDGTNWIIANTAGASTDNTAVGRDALIGITSGTQNVGVGRDALKATTTVTGNVAVGYQAMLANITGATNVAVGAAALAANTTQDSNTAIGYHALNLAGAAGNTAVGYNAGALTTSGFFNCALGYHAHVLNTTGINNVAIGAMAQDTSAAVSYATALGAKTEAGANGAVAIGIDNAATGASTAVVNEIALGTALHTLNVIGNVKLGGAAKTLGFYGAAGVVKPTGVTVDAAGIHAALVSLGLISA